MTAWRVAELQGPADGSAPDVRDHSYGVDSGHGGFFSVEAGARLGDEWPKGVAEELARQMKATYRDTRDWSLDTPPFPTMYFPVAQSGGASTMAILVRAGGEVKKRTQKAIFT